MLEIGLYDLMSSRSSEGFFYPWTIDCLLGESGNHPCVKAAFVMDVIIGLSTSNSSFSNHLGIRSSSHCFFGVFLRICDTSFMVTFLKLTTEGTGLCSIVGAGAIAS